MNNGIHEYHKCGPKVLLNKSLIFMNRSNKYVLDTDIVTVTHVAIQKLEYSITIMSTKHS